MLCRYIYIHLNCNHVNLDLLSSHNKITVQLARNLLAENADRYIYSMSVMKVTRYILKANRIFGLELSLRRESRFINLDTQSIFCLWFGQMNLEAAQKIISIFGNSKMWKRLHKLDILYIVLVCKKWEIINKTLFNFRMDIYYWHNVSAL